MRQYYRSRTTKEEKNNISYESDTEKGKKRNTEKENEGEGKLYHILKY